LVAKGEMHKAGQATGAPGVYFTPFMFFMVKNICISSVCSASFPQSRDKTVLAFFVNFRTTIRHILVFLERFSCIHLHKFIIMNMNMKSAQKCSGEFSSL